MKIVITGKIGSGKTELLKAMNYKNTIYLQEYVDKTLFVKGHPVYEALLFEFGPRVVAKGKVRVGYLEGIKLRNKHHLNRLNILVLEFVKAYLESLEGDYIVEMGSYVDYAEDFKQFFDSVILITREKKLIKKSVDKMTRKSLKLIKSRKPHFDYLLENNIGIEEAADSLKSLIENNWPDKFN